MGSIRSASQRWCGKISWQASPCDNNNLRCDGNLVAPRTPKSRWLQQTPAIGACISRVQIIRGATAGHKLHGSWNMKMLARKKGSCCVNHHSARTAGRTAHGVILSKGAGHDSISITPQTHYITHNYSLSSRAASAITSTMSCPATIALYRATSTVFGMPAMLHV